MRWGLARKSARGGIELTSCGSIRSDDLQSAEGVRTAWLNGQRGIVPLAGFISGAQAGRTSPTSLRASGQPTRVWSGRALGARRGRR